MIFKSPSLPVAMMLLVRVSTENRSGTSEVSPSAPASAAPCARRYPRETGSAASATRLLASPLTTRKTLICATATSESSCSIRAANRSMLSGGAVTSSVLLRGFGVISTWDQHAGADQSFLLAVDRQKLQNGRPLVLGPVADCPDGRLERLRDVDGQHVA